MTRNRALVLAAVVLVFMAIGGYLVSPSYLGHGGSHVSVAMKVSGSTATPADLSVRQGDSVTMTVTADRAEEIHLHGYDIQFVVATPGGSVTHTFTADKSGAFPIEIEESGTPLGQLTVSP